MRNVLAMGCLTLMVGCSAQVKLSRMSPDDPETRKGIAYSLPFTQFDVTVTRVVTACKPKAIEHSTKAEIGPASSAPDPRQAFTIDSNSLSGPFRVGSIKVDYGKAGVTKGLNGASADHAAQVIASVIGTAIKIATLGTVSIPTAPAPAVAVGPLLNAPIIPAEEACAPKIKAVVDAVKVAADELAAASVASKAAFKGFAVLKAQSDALPGALDEESKKKLVAAKVKSDKAAGVATAKKEALDKLLAEITDVQTMTLPPTGSDFSNNEPPGRDLIALWQNPLFKEKIASIQSVHWVLGQRNGDIKAAVAPQDDQSKPPGIPYRMPKLGRFSVCDGECSKTTAMAEATTLIAQLGQTYFLPCNSPAFSSMTCAIALDDSGAPTSVGSDQKSSPAEVAAGVANDAVTQILAYRKSKTVAELESVKERTELVKARNDLAAALAASKAHPQTDMQIPIAVSTANLEFRADSDARAAAAAAAAAAQ